MEGKIERLLQWIKNTYDENFQVSTHSYISPKINVLDVKSCGRGIYACDEIKKREQIIRIPPSFLLNSTSVIRHITSFNDEIKLNESHYVNLYIPKTTEDKFTEIYRKFALKELLNMSSFQLISLFLCFEKQRSEHSFWKPFIDMLPGITDFDLAPLIWQALQVQDFEYLLSSLPRSTQKHADKVYKRFTKDYEIVKTVLFSKFENIADEKKVVEEILPMELFLWAWMCINSRCLYMELPHSKNSSDNFTMAPYVDFLNHSSNDQCSLKIDSLGFQVFTTTSYKNQEQLFLSYGPHSNDFLLCEYGFLLASGNKWNDIDITEFIIPLLKKSQAEFLKNNDYFGDYTVSAETGTSFRTEVVLSVLQEPTPDESRKLQALLNGYTDASAYKTNSNILLKTILEKIIYDCERHTILEYSDEVDLKTRERKKAIGLLYRNMKEIAEITIKEL